MRKRYVENFGEQRLQVRESLPPRSEPLKMIGVPVPKLPEFGQLRDYLTEQLLVRWMISNNLQFESFDQPSLTLFHGPGVEECRPLRKRCNSQIS